jgi:hypothetical protein
MTDDILDSLFHWAALRAYLEVYTATKQNPPDSEATRIRAYQLYEEALAEKNRRKQPADTNCSPRREPHPCVSGTNDLQPTSTDKN